MKYDVKDEYGNKIGEITRQPTLAENIIGFTIFTIFLIGLLYITAIALSVILIPALAVIVTPFKMLIEDKTKNLAWAIIIILLICAAIFAGVQSYNNIFQYVEAPNIYIQDGQIIESTHLEPVFCVTCALPYGLLATTLGFLIVWGAITNGWLLHIGALLKSYFIVVVSLYGALFDALPDFR